MQHERRAIGAGLEGRGRQCRHLPIRKVIVRCIGHATGVYSAWSVHGSSSPTQIRGLPATCPVTLWCVGYRSTWMLRRFSPMKYGVLGVNGRCVALSSTSAGSAAPHGQPESPLRRASVDAPRASKTGFRRREQRKKRRGLPDRASGDFCFSSSSEAVLRVSFMPELLLHRLAVEQLLIGGRSRVARFVSVASARAVRKNNVRFHA